MHPNTAFIPTDINTQSNKRNSLPRAMPLQNRRLAWG